MSSLALSDKIVFVLYFLMVASYGYWVYRKKKDTVSASQDFFLAEGSLTWWAIGASLIASNISAEQFIGMSGEGFFVGVAIAAYEWIAALGLIIIAVWFIPIYLKNKIYTMPQFLKTRYNESVALVMAIFWTYAHGTYHYAWWHESNWIHRCYSGCCFNNWRFCNRIYGITNCRSTNQSCNRWQRTCRI
jgi:SSS family solute:Na+ symporter